MHQPRIHGLTAKTGVQLRAKETEISAGVSIQNYIQETNQIEINTKSATATKKSHFWELHNYQITETNPIVKYDWCVYRCARPARPSATSLNAGGVRISITRADQFDDAPPSSLQQSLDSICHQLALSSPAEFGRFFQPAITICLLLLLLFIPPVVKVSWG